MTTITHIAKPEDSSWLFEGFVARKRGSLRARHVAFLEANYDQA
jgi:hypothetical protein